MSSDHGTVDSHDMEDGSGSGASSGPSSSHAQEQEVPSPVEEDSDDPFGLAEVEQPVVKPVARRSRNMEVSEPFGGNRLVPSGPGWQMTCKNPLHQPNCTRTRTSAMGGGGLGQAPAQVLGGAWDGPHMQDQGGPQGEVVDDAPCMG